MRRRQLLLGGLLAGALLAVPAASLAARVEVVEVGTMGLVGQELRLEDESFESNRHRIEPAPGGGYRITGNGAGPVRAGAGCSDTSPEGGAEREVTCTGSNIIRSRFRLGDLSDLLLAEALPIQVTAYGGEDQDDLRGGARGDLLYGGDDSDALRGGARGDRLVAGAGPDLVLGQAGGDRMLGNGGSDNITGGTGEDAIFGHAGPDFLDGSQGEDHISAGSGNDTIISSMGATLSSSDKARDVVNCGPGRDRVSADRKDRLNDCEEVTFG